MKLFDSEWKVMEVLWQQNDQTAKAVSLASCAKRRLEQEHNLYGDQKMHRQGRD